MNNPKPKKLPVVRRIIRAMIKEEIIKDNDISDIKGKIVESVEVNDNTVILHFDDDSKFKISTEQPDQKITYHYFRGMIKSQGSEGGFGNSTN